MRFHQLVAGFSALVLTAAAGCVGDDPGDRAPSTPGDGDASSGETEDGGRPSSDASSGGVDSSCASHCEDDDVVGCEGARESCALGCLDEAEGPRCATFEPLGPASAADLKRKGLGSLTLTAAQSVDVGNGEIRTTAAASLRQPNDDPDVDQVKNNLAFRIEGDVAVFVADNITFTGNPKFEGTAAGVIGRATRPVVFVAQRDLKVHADLTLPCGALGGGVGGSPDVNGGVGGGAGGGGFNTDARTGGGGGHSTQGGQGGNAQVGGALVVGASGGGAHNATFALGGGGGGGAGGGGGNKFSGGGGGGAAIALVAGRAIFLGNGTALHGVNAGGCGAGAFSSSVLKVTGAGGGAGGFISVEAPVITAALRSGLAANGGAGAGTDASGVRSGQRGQLSTAAALGGGDSNTPAACDALGGTGASALNETVGQAPSGNSGCADARGGGGGGATGRIVISSLTGEIAAAAGAEPFFLSPIAPASIKRVLLTAEP